jgi:anti-sigma regulatory factor (Ser/Thr protein kinase)
MSPLVEEAPSLPQKLSREEDDELRRLHWFSRIGKLSAAKCERLVELRIRDRRKEIRPPREFAEEKVDTTAGTRRKWYKFSSH